MWSDMVASLVQRPLFTVSAAMHGTDDASNLRQIKQDLNDTKEATTTVKNQGHCEFRWTRRELEGIVADLFTITGGLMDPAQQQAISGDGTDGDRQGGDPWISRSSRRSHVTGDGTDGGRQGGDGLDNSCSVDEPLNVVSGVPWVSMQKMRAMVSHRANQCAPVLESLDEVLMPSIHQCAPVLESLDEALMPSLGRTTANLPPTRLHVFPRRSPEDGPPAQKKGNVGSSPRAICFEDF